MSRFPIPRSDLTSATVTCGWRKTMSSQSFFCFERLAKACQGQAVSVHPCLIELFPPQETPDLPGLLTDLHERKTRPSSRPPGDVLRLYGEHHDELLGDLQILHALLPGVCDAVCHCATHELQICVTDLSSLMWSASRISISVVSQFGGMKDGVKMCQGFGVKRPIRILRKTAQLRSLSCWMWLQGIDGTAAKLLSSEFCVSHQLSSTLLGSRHISSGLQRRDLDLGCYLQSWELY